MPASPYMAMTAKELRDNVEAAFNKLDTNKDGVLTRDEFVESCMKVTEFKKPYGPPVNSCLCCGLASLTCISFCYVSVRLQKSGGEQNAV